MVRSKKLQGALVEFTKRVHEILMNEFKTKKVDI
jgi:hypothetical protein